MQLSRTHSPRRLISLVPMIDVLLILLVFFMVTSSYLNLDMVPMVEPQTETAATSESQGATPMLIRLTADGGFHLRGQALDGVALGAAISARLDDDPLGHIILLPSPRATTQQLVSAMDIATLAGATRLRLIRLEAP